MQLSIKSSTKGVQGCRSHCNNSVGGEYSGLSRSVGVFNTFRCGSQTKLSPCKTKIHKNFHNLSACNNALTLMQSFSKLEFKGRFQVGIIVLSASALLQGEYLGPLDLKVYPKQVFPGQLGFVATRRCACMPTWAAGVHQHWFFWFGGKTGHVCQL